MESTVVLKKFNEYRIVYNLRQAMACTPWKSGEVFSVEKAMKNALGETYYSGIDVFSYGVNSEMEISLCRAIFYEWFRSLLNYTFRLCKKIDNAPRVLCTFGNRDESNLYRIVQLRDVKTREPVGLSIRCTIESLREDACGVKSYVPLLAGCEFVGSDGEAWINELFSDLVAQYLSQKSKKKSKEQ